MAPTALRPLSSVRLVIGFSGARGLKKSLTFGGPSAPSPIVLICHRVLHGKCTRPPSEPALSMGRCARWRRRISRERLSWKIGYRWRFVEFYDGRSNYSSWSSRAITDSELPVKARHTPSNRQPAVSIARHIPIGTGLDSDSFSHSSNQTLSTDHGIRDLCWQVADGKNSAFAVGAQTAIVSEYGIDTLRMIYMTARQLADSCLLRYEFFKTYRAARLCVMHFLIGCHVGWRQYDIRAGVPGTRFYRGDDRRHVILHCRLLVCSVIMFDIYKRW
jgi:hypothetical protein